MHIITIDGKEDAGAYSVQNELGEDVLYIFEEEDDDAQLLDTREFAGKILKLIVRKKTDHKKFERYIDKIYASDVHELKILENFQLQENEEFEAFESEDTLSILNRYVEESDIDLQKSTIQDIIKEVYQEACEVI